MQIEKITENKIQVIITLEDLEKKHIDLHSFMSDSIESQDLFYDVLEKAKKEIGFETQDYKLIIEAFAIPDSKFILTVTRISVNSKVPLPNKKISSFKPSTYIYKFSNFDDFCEFCTYLYATNIINISASYLKKSCLIYYKSNYYFIIKTNSKQKNYKKLHNLIMEFALCYDTCTYLENELNEYGKQIFKTNAIATCINHFA